MAQWNSLFILVYSHTVMSHRALCVLRVLLLLFVRSFIFRSLFCCWCALLLFFSLSLFFFFGIFAVRTVTLAQTVNVNANMQCYCTWVWLLMLDFNILIYPDEFKIRDTVLLDQFLITLMFLCVYSGCFLFSSFSLDHACDCNIAFMIA